MFKNFLMKKMLKSQLKGMPEAEQDRIINVVIEHPELFEKIGKEIQEKIKGGMDQTMATMRVMEKYKDDLQKVMK
ncbi:hypothetical protein IT403_01885 [Candidatus Nomurabacteria bacterium]|nr:hypothetical protein [Candidatus Nomurabacteria bacterium]